eukprot:TRINITY_DN16171_c0_g1_i1.p1 TRINITY_DN16171_c0_g1~~TRINITY_DN16171_c0_g1_i1.p1  ORF type:complete len:210 (+),score=28.12 TRINITY_DN16171_c0_g1_i1:66-632(+)
MYGPPTAWGGRSPTRPTERQAAEVRQRAATATAAAAAVAPPATADATNRRRRRRAGGVLPHHRRAVSVDEVGRRTADRWWRRRRRRRWERAFGRLQRRLQLPRIQVEGAGVREEGASAVAGVDAGEATSLRRVGRGEGVHGTSGRDVKTGAPGGVDGRKRGRASTGSTTSGGGEQTRERNGGSAGRLF